MSNEIGIYFGIYIAESLVATLSGFGVNLIKMSLSSKTSYRAVKAYRRYVSHGIKDPIFIMNATSSICAGASLLTLGSSKIVRFTPLASISPTLYNVSAGLSCMSDGLDESFTWRSPII